MEAAVMLHEEAIPVLKSSLELKRRTLEFNLRRYRERLSAFERQYRMRSQEFAAKFEVGDLGDDAEWFEWQYVFDAYNETNRQLELLKSIHL